MEKVINEFKVIETDDGFRIEIKGDKDAIREMWGNFGSHPPRGGKRKSGRGFGFGPRFWTHFGDMCGHWSRSRSMRRGSGTRRTDPDCLIGKPISY